MNLVENTKQQEKSRLDWLKQAWKAAEMVNKLPQGIKDMEGTADCGYDGVMELCFFNGLEDQKICEECGAIFDKPKFCDYSGEFMAVGKLGDIKIKIYHLAAKPECKVNKIPYTAFMYETTCEETE